MFTYLRRKLGLALDRDASNREYEVLFSSLSNLHKRLDRIETALGPWRADGVGIQSGISEGRDPNDPAVQSESAAIGSRAIAALRAKFGSSGNTP